MGAEPPHEPNACQYVSGAVLGGIIGRRKRGVSALADTVPFFGKAENTTQNKTVNPLPRRGASIRNDRREW